MNRFKIAILILAVPVIGCSVATQIAADAIGVPLTSKEVVDKLEPRTLLARDGTTCTVTEARYRKVEIGDEVLCAWSRSPAPGRGTPAGRPSRTSSVRADPLRVAPAGRVVGAVRDRRTVGGA